MARLSIAERLAQLIELPGSECVVLVPDVVQHRLDLVGQQHPSLVVAQQLLAEAVHRADLRGRVDSCGLKLACDVGAEVRGDHAVEGDDQDLFSLAAVTIRLTEAQGPPRGPKSHSRPRPSLTPNTCNIA